MSRKSLLSLKVITLAGAFLLLFSSPALSGRIGGAGPQLGDTLQAQLGLRFTSQLPASPRQGQSFQGVILSPEKLTALGIPGLKGGDTITLKVLPGDGKFQVLNKGMSYKLHLNEQGIVKRTIPTPRAPSPAGAARVPQTNPRPVLNPALNPASQVR